MRFKIKKIYIACIVCISCFLFTNCNKNKYTKFDANYSYHLKHKSGYTEGLEQNGLIIYQMKLIKNNDSIFWDSKYFTENNYCVFHNDKSNTEKNGFEKLLSNLFSIKDSIEIKCKAQQLFQDFFQKPLPYFLNNNDEVLAQLYIDTIIDETQLQLMNERYNKENKNSIEEQAAIKYYINKSSIKYRAIGSLYMSTITNGNTITIKKGDQVSVTYIGYFLDGTNCDNNGSKPVDFEYGEQAQLLPGLMKAISLSKFDDSISVIIPSALAYGDSGNSTGFIKPFTPLRYEVNIKKMK
jgi:FKBP-type peptidyl-prolyl cis-trans isomerase